MRSESNSTELVAPPLPTHRNQTSGCSDRSPIVIAGSKDAPGANPSDVSEDLESTTPIETNTESPKVDENTCDEHSTTENSTKHRWLASILRRLENRNVVAGLVSLVVHLTALLVLALVHYSSHFGFTNEPMTIIQLSGEDSRIELSRVEVQLAGDVDPAPPQETPQQETLSSQSSSTQVNASEVAQLLTVEKSEYQPSSSDAIQSRMQSLNQKNLQASFSSTGIEGRKSESRRQVALQRGGTLASEQAVEAALQWLANHQTPGGAWSLVHDKGECKGQCRNPGCKDRFDPAATGLSLLAFLGAGYTHREGKYQQNVTRGLYYLRQVVEETPQGSSFLAQSERGMYNHGIATFALCEAYQLTQDPDLKRVCQEAVNFIASSQSYQGGWGYLPKQPGDLTISGWQMMALKSASAAGLEVQPSTILRAKNFLGSQLGKDGVNYFYRQPAEKSITCTAIGVLMRMFLGDNWTDPSIIEAMKQISQHDDYGLDIYFRYYATLTLFHAGGSFWENWNPRCRDYLVRTQATEGHEAGSWYFENPFGKEGGRLYTTAMAAMTLEVYYRYSPLYQQADKPFEL